VQIYLLGQVVDMKFRDLIKIVLHFNNIAEGK